MTQIHTLLTGLSWADAAAWLVAILPATRVPTARAADAGELQRGEIVGLAGKPDVRLYCAQRGIMWP